MSEIDRIHPIVRPVLGPPSTERIQPSGERSRHHAREDQLSLHTSDREEEPQDEDQEREEPDSTEGLDLSI